MEIGYMAPTVRTRTYNHFVSRTGRRWWIGAWATKSMSVGESATCDDVIGNKWNVNTFSLHRHHKETPALRGKLYTSGGAVHSIWEDYPIGYSSSYAADPDLTFADPTMGQLNEIGWNILAKCNPGQAHVNVPQQLGELKDLPDLIRRWGISLLGKAAKGYLSWRWCLKPMISDVRKMLQFVETANKRFRELRRLRDVGYIRRRCDLGTETVCSSPYSVLLHSEAFTMYGRRTDLRTRKSWGSVNWKVSQDSQILNMEDAELMKFTRRTMLGLNSYGALEAAWELVPWSWFIDWFSNVGTLISASNNAVGCTWSRPCVMMISKSEAIIHLREDEAQWKRNMWTCPFRWVKVHKARFPALPIIPFPTPYLPTLTSRHWSILASLAVLRSGFGR